MSQTTVSIPVRDLASIPLVCAWENCREQCASAAPLPEGWVWLATYRGTAQPAVLDFGSDPVIRDAVLCPLHTADLESKLKRI